MVSSPFSHFDRIVLLSCFLYNRKGGDHGIHRALQVAMSLLLLQLLLLQVCLGL